MKRNKCEICNGSINDLYYHIKVFDDNLHTGYKVCSQKCMEKVYNSYIKNNPEGSTKYSSTSDYMSYIIIKRIRN